MRRGEDEFWILLWSLGVIATGLQDKNTMGQDPTSAG